MLSEAGLSPTFLVGGDDGRTWAPTPPPVRDEHIVVEADEFDAAFLSYQPDLAVVTNIEPDHLDFYGSFDELVAAFAQFLKSGAAARAASSPAPTTPPSADLLGRGTEEPIPPDARTSSSTGWTRRCDWVVSHRGQLPAGEQEFLVGLHGATLRRVPA